ncbi:MAG: polysaccharide biosynthesis C-terminal domain-containing protein [Schleiferiaceae bacterium]|nr:polysaccharide biosynthesis C-terminal domain-containing protein [Schleiferiaceae bacterium]
MNNAKKQISSGALINLVGILLGAALNLWLLPKLFSTEELGMYRWMERSAVLLSNILLFGVHRSFTKFHSDPSKDKKEFESTVVGRSTLLMLAVGVLVFVFGPLLAPYFSFKPEDAYLLRYLSFFIVSGMAFLMAVSAAATTKKIAIPVFIKNMGLRIAMIALALVLFFNSGVFSFSHWLITYAWASLALGAIALLYAWNRVKPTFYLRHLWARMDGDVQKFAWISVFSVLIEIGISTLDIQMLSMLTDMNSVGIYSMAFFMGSVIDGIRRPINQMLGPQISKSWNTNNMVVLRKIYEKTSSAQMMINAAYVIMVVVNVEWIFSLIPDGERFYPAIPVVVWTVARKYINAAFGSNGEIIANSPFYQLNMKIGSIMLVINVLLNLLFIPRYGILGVAYSGFIAVIFVNTIRAIMIYRKSGLQPFTKESLAILLGALAVGALCYKIPFDGILKFLVSGLIVVAALLVNRKFIKNLLLR